MSNPIFNPGDFKTGVELVVGECNGVAAVQRWEQETPLFAEKISARISEETKSVLDYGCGVGRIAKALLVKHADLEVVGVDDSTKHLQMALAYVNDERFEALRPAELARPVDLAYCFYVLQHIPAIELRDALYRLHGALKPGGLLLCCTSDYRMAVRFDKIQFFDDRFLGVNVKRELERFFEPVEPMFTEEEIGKSEILQRILLGKHAGDRQDYVTHFAWVYKRREIEGPLMNAPFKP